MVDFDKGKELANKFSGSEVKTTIRYNNEVYMIKYPDPVRDKRNKLSYMNNQFSEHIGCCIFEHCGFETQKTIMGYFTAPSGIRKIVVACRDFTQNGDTLYEFSKLVSQIQVEGKVGTSIECVRDVIRRNPIIVEKEVLLEKFWDMFVIDALIGNSDRYYDNWGIIEAKQNISFAPIYDCGSSLSALVDDATMQTILTSRDETELRNKEYNVNSCYSLQGQRIFYHSIFRNSPSELTDAIKRIVPVINLLFIDELIDETIEMSEIRKEYIKKAVRLRYEQILLPALSRVRKQR